MAKKVYDSVVLGGGISGLSAAFYLNTLCQSTRKVCLLEKGHRLGGWIHSCKTQDGSVHEFGTRSIRPAGNVGKNTLDLIDTLGLVDRLLPVTSSHPASRNRFIYAKGSIHMLPSGLRSLFQHVQPFSKPLISSVFKEPFRRKTSSEDESIKDFFSRRFGSESEKKYGSVILGSLFAKPEDLASILSPEHAGLSRLLSEIPSVSVAVVNLEFDGKILPVEGFGYLVPSCEPSEVLGVVFDSCTFPQHNNPTKDTTRLTCMMGGGWFEELFGDPDTVDPDRLLSVALETLRDHLCIQEKPFFSKVNILKDCIPQYTVGHSKRLESIDGYIRSHKLPLSLLGASYHGVSVNDCIYNARKEVLALKR